jgi:hypothetical protein
VLGPGLWSFLAAAMATTTALVAAAVHERLGLGLVRQSWFNMHRARSTVLLASGAVALFT